MTMVDIERMEPIARPVVKVIEVLCLDGPSQVWPYEARCTHCTFRYGNSVKSDVTEHARHHRDDHRAGRVPAPTKEGTT